MFMKVKLLLSSEDGKWTLVLITAFLLHFITECMVLFSSSFAFGSDGYYYAAQIKSALVKGRFFSPDSSPVLYVMLGASYLWNDIVITNKLVVALLSSVVVLPLYYCGKTLKSPSAGIVLVLLYAFNAMSAEFSFEYVKNLGGIVSFAFFMWRAAVLYREGISRKNIGLLLLFLLLTFITHKLMAFIALIFCALFLIPLIQKNKFLLLIPLGLIILVPALSFLLPNIISLSDFSRLTSLFTLHFNIAPYSYYKIAQPAIWQLPELVLLSVSPAALVLFFRNRNEAFYRFSLFLLPFYCLSVLPFFQFNSADMAYRLFIIIFIPASFFLTAAIPDMKKTFLTALLILFSVYYYLSLDRFITRSQFNYRLYSLILPLIELPENSLLIVHQGFDYFYCYNGKGDSMHFLPEAKHQGRPIYRLAFGVKLDEVKTILSNRSVSVFPGGYSLMEEKSWTYLLDNIGHARKSELNNWKNPSLARPEFMKRNERFKKD